MNANASLSPEARAMEAAVEAQVFTVCILRLYVTGSSPRSVLAVANIRKICDEYLQGCHNLEIVDLSAKSPVGEKRPDFSRANLG